LKKYQKSKSSIEKKGDPLALFKVKVDNKTNGETSNLFGNTSTMAGTFSLFGTTTNNSNSSLFSNTNGSSLFGINTTTSSSLGQLTNFLPKERNTLDLFDNNPNISLFNNTTASTLFGSK